MNESETTEPDVNALSVFERLYLKISWMQKEGHKPTAIYLGHASLFEMEKRNGPFDRYSDKPMTFMGLPVYILVGHTDHVNVTSEVPDVKAA